MKKSINEGKKDLIMSADKAHNGIYSQLPWARKCIQLMAIHESVKDTFYPLRNETFK